MDSFFFFLIFYAPRIPGMISLTESNDESKEVPLQTWTATPHPLLNLKRLIDFQIAYVDYAMQVKRLWI